MQPYIATLPREAAIPVQGLAEETGEYEVGRAVCNDGKSYDIKLDKSFNVVSKREDHI